MAIIVNLPTQRIPILIDREAAGIYTNASGFLRVYKNGKRTGLPVRVSQGDWLDFSGKAGTLIKLQ